MCVYVSMEDVVGKDSPIQEIHQFSHLLAAVMKLLTAECEQPTTCLEKGRKSLGS